MRKVSHELVTFGSDPEFFFSKNGEVVIAGEVLPEKGLKAGIGKFIIDGVQAEFNPPPETCRARMFSNFRALFSYLRETIRQDVELDFSQIKKLPKKQLDKIEEKHKKFGCDPSKNYYGKSDITVDPMVYPFRSAGGHIHLGRHNTYTNKVLENPDRLVPILDLIVGNTCVLIDRDKGNIERRKVYGRAGEYRLPPHGLEYRTLSNFWLRSYPLMSMVFGLARFAINIVASDLDEEYLKLVDLKDVQKAINENDFDLALSNFNKIRDLIAQTTDIDYGDFAHPLNSESLEWFEHFVDMGQDHWFSKDIKENWDSITNDHNQGFECFLRDVVAPDLEKYIKSKS